jgi:GxxExxY protein
MGERILWKDLSYRIVESSIKVWKTLGYGFLEKVYENALAIEFQEQKIPFRQQYPIKVFYSEHVVGDYVSDLLVESKIILELKSAEAICAAHVAQTLNYLKATNVRLGIILNFGPKKLEFKRLIL